MTTERRILLFSTSLIKVKLGYLKNSNAAAHTVACNAGVLWVAIERHLGFKVS